MLDLENMTLDAIHGGRNGRVYKVSSHNKASYIVKFYFKSKKDKRDRLKTEFESLKFLWRHNIRCIPEPILIDGYHNFAVYEYVAGRPILSSDVGVDDIHQMSQFILKLKNVSNDPEASYFLKASEACFSFKEIILSIQARFKQFRKSKLPVSEESRKLFTFLFQHLEPTFKQFVNADYMRSPKIGKRQQILSPSDLGFHNAICRKNGKICFLDFEYFGWDDPAKTTCDFMLHPAMDLKQALKKKFAGQVLEIFSEDHALKDRIKMVFPLYGVKWCLIILNEFLRENLLRRQFASNEFLNIAVLQRKQLTKARQMLDRVLKEHEHFSDLYF